MATRILAAEDGNLNKSTLVVSRKTNYVDLDLSFTAKGSGEIYKKFDAAAVKQAVKTLVSTNKFEKPFDPEYGGDIRGLLFELVNDPDIEFEIRERMEETIARYEPRVKVLNIEVNDQRDLNTLTVLLTFKIINTEETITLTTSFSRLR